VIEKARFENLMYINAWKRDKSIQNQRKQEKHSAFLLGFSFDNVNG